MARPLCQRTYRLVTRVRAAGLLGIAAGILLSGCATGVNAQGPLGPLSRAAIAKIDARALLAAARLPGDAQPAASLRPAATGLTPTSAIDLHRTLWVGTIPSGRSLTPVGASLLATGTSNTGLVRWYTVSFPPTAALPTRQLVYGFWTGAKEGYILRVDAQDIWVPKKPRAAFVAPGAAAIVITSRGVGTHRVTNREPIAKITEIVNSLQLYPRGGITSCPADTGTDILVLTFHALPAPTQEGLVLPWSGRTRSVPASGVRG